MLVSSMARLDENPRLLVQFVRGQFCWFYAIPYCS